MNMELGKFSPDVRIGFVSASRNCFPRELSKSRSEKILGLLSGKNVDIVLPENGGIIETRQDAASAAKSFLDASCDAAVLYLGNFSPEIEDASFVKAFGKPVLLIAAAEESAKSIAENRGDALCGLMSASLAINKRGLSKLVHIPQKPLVSADGAAAEIIKFAQIVRTVKGISNSTIGLFGPRPRDFESCNYNAASLLSIGVEIEEFGLFDLEEEIEKISLSDSEMAGIKSQILSTDGISDAKFVDRLSLYEKALLNKKEQLNLSGITTQCWTRQETHSGHVPCFINSRLTEKGFPVACENDAYSLVAELMCQYASGDAVTMLDINHTIPAEMLSGYPDIKPEDVIGLFHCGNVPAKYLKSPKVCHQLIMSRLMEKDKAPDVTRGTLEGSILPSDITMFQIHGSGDKLRAYICEGSFIDVDPNTFGSVGVAHIDGFMRFYRNCLLGRFHHHAAVAFKKCGGVLFDALKMLGVDEIYTPRSTLYDGENPFE